MPDLETLLELLDLLLGQLLAELDWPDWDDVFAVLADVRAPLGKVRVVEDGLAVGPDDRHRQGHGFVTRKLRLAGYRNVA